MMHLGDCRDVLPTLPAASVDAVVTDPPYGIGFKYATHDDSPDGYGEWLWGIMEKAEALCRPGSPVFVWQAMPNVRHFSRWFPRDFRLFAAAKNFVQMRRGVTMQYAFDPVVVWWTPGPRWTSAKGNRDYHVANTAALVCKPNRLERQHPCPRPLDQVRHIIEQWVRPGGTVLDPFLGSGTTAVACAETGRDFIGVESDPSYFAIAERRLAEVQGGLFAGVG